MKLSNHQKFLDVADQLAREISGMRPGDRLPTASEIRDRFSITIATACKVIKELQSRGLIQSKRGIGSVVSSLNQRKFILCVEPPGVLEASQHWWLFQSSLISACNRDYEHYTVITVPGERLCEETLSLLNRSQQIAGVIFFRDVSAFLQHTPFLRKLGLPRIFYGSSTFREQVGAGCGCFYDEAEIVTLAMRHLQQAGHRRIGCIFDSTSPLDVMRRDMYRRFLSSAGLPDDGSMLLDTSGLHQVWFDRMMLNLSMRHQFRAYLGNISALLILHDNQAAILLQHIRELGIRVPEELSVVSIDNLPLCELMRPRLDSVSINIYENATLCLDMLEQYHRQPGSYFARVPISLSVRESVMQISSTVSE